MCLLHTLDGSVDSCFPNCLEGKLQVSICHIRTNLCRNSSCAFVKPCVFSLRFRNTFQSCLTIWRGWSLRRTVTANSPRRGWACSARRTSTFPSASPATALGRYSRLRLHTLPTMHQQLSGGQLEELVHRDTAYQTHYRAEMTPQIMLLFEERCAVTLLSDWHYIRWNTPLDLEARVSEMETSSTFHRETLSSERV